MSVKSKTFLWMLLWFLITQTFSSEFSKHEVNTIVEDPESVDGEINMQQDQMLVTEQIKQTKRYIDDDEKVIISSTYNKEDSERSRFKQSTNTCEYCNQANTLKYLTQSQKYNFKLCHNCYQYERTHDELILPNKRGKAKQLSNICEFCNQLNSAKCLVQNATLKIKLCRACYIYEKRHGKLILPNERNYAKFNPSTNICGYCNRLNTQKHLIQSKLGEFKLCHVCYQYEKYHGELKPRGKRRKSKTSSNICEYCNRLSNPKSMVKSKLTAFKLCNTCYKYKRTHDDKQNFKTASNEYSDKKRKTFGIKKEKQIEPEDKNNEMFRIESDYEKQERNSSEDDIQNAGKRNRYGFKKKLLDGNTSYQNSFGEQVYNYIKYD